MSGLSILNRTVVCSFRPLLKGSKRVVTHTRQFSFSFAGPKKLEDIIKKDLVEDKTGAEVADIWHQYHENKEDVLGIVLKGKDGKMVLSNAASCPFFVQPVFRDDGFFMLVSQFQAPSHFLMAYLEDYKMDPASATPLMTFSVFDDYSSSKEVALVRGDILNKSIQAEEGLKVIQCLVDQYKQEEDFAVVKMFNEQPDEFDIDDFISRMNDRWKQSSP